ncbi:MAG: hypothetical protein ACLRSD_00935 [Oscillibacter sp.]
MENLEGLTDADDPDADNEDEDGKTATFPFLSRFFGGNPAANDAQNGNEAEQTQSPRSNKKVEKEQAQIPRLLLHQSLPARTRRQARRGRRPRGGDRGASSKS